MRAVAGFGLFASLPGLTGCFSSVRKVARVETVGTYQTATPAELEAGIAAREASVRTLIASVQIRASTGGEKEGKVKTYTSFGGYIFVQKPRNLRVLLQLPLIGSRAMDMVSDGKMFTLMAASAHGTRWVQGTNEITKPSPNGLENLRPAVFLDSLLVTGVGPDELAAVTQGSHVLEADHGRKPEVDEPEYDLSIYKADGKILHEKRTIHVSRVTLLPEEQDIRDEQGRVVTQATYANYAPVGDIQFPRLITISRPLDEYSLSIEVTKLTLNEALPSDQFELHIPVGVTVQHME